MKEKILFLIKINRLHIFIICLHDFINTLAVFHIFFYLLVYFVHKHKERERVKKLALFLGWTTRIRTWTNRTKTCCATITP